MEWKKKLLIWLPLSMVVAFATAILTLKLGTVHISFMSLFDILLGNKRRTTLSTVILEIRLPRVLLGMTTGWGLAVVGATLQALLKNPLADPYILGISSGAAFGATLVFALQQLFNVFLIGYVSPVAFLFALFAGLLTYLIANQGGKLPVGQVILAGVIVSMLFGAATTLTIVFGWRGTTNVMFWLFGSLSNASRGTFEITFIPVIMGSIFLFFFSSELNAMALGEEEAMHLGVETKRIKIVLLITSSLMTAFIVSNTGIIGFVGLVIPHVARFIVGADNRLVLPLSAVIGAIFLPVCDSIARTVASPAEVPIGVVTAFIGTPLFIYLMKKGKRV